MSEDAAIRRANLASLGLGPTELSRRVGHNPSYWSTLMHGPKSFGEKAARHIEEKLGLPRGWLDELHDRHSLRETGASYALDLTDQLAAAVRNLPPDALRDLAELLGLFVRSRGDETLAPAVRARLRGRS